MSPGPEDQWRPPEPPGRPPRPGGGQRPTGRPRWMPLVIVGLAVLALLAYTSTTGSSAAKAKIDYSKFLKLAAHAVPKPAAERIVDLVLHLERVEDAGEVVRSLALTPRAGQR